MTGRAKRAGSRGLGRNTVTPDPLLLLTTGHYDVTRADLERPEVRSPEGEFSDEEAAALFDPFGANAGVHPASTRTFDGWPMISQVPGYEARKHPTFYFTRKSDDEILISFQPAPRGGVAGAGRACR